MTIDDIDVGDIDDDPEDEELEINKVNLDPQISTRFLTPINLQKIFSNAQFNISLNLLIITSRSTCWSDSVVFNRAVNYSLLLLIFYTNYRKKGLLSTLKIQNLWCPHLLGTLRQPRKNCLRAIQYDTILP